MIGRATRPRSRPRARRAAIEAHADRLHRHRDRRRPRRRLHPLLLIGGLPAWCFAQFAVDACAIASHLGPVSLTVTPMICGRYFRRRWVRRRTRADRILKPTFAALLRGYGRALGWSLQRRP